VRPKIPFASPSSFSTTRRVDRDGCRGSLNRSIACTPPPPFLFPPKRSPLLLASCSDLEWRCQRNPLWEGIYDEREEGTLVSPRTTTEFRRTERKWRLLEPDNLYCARNRAPITTMRVTPRVRGREKKMRTMLSWRFCGTRMSGPGSVRYFGNLSEAS